MEYFLTQNGGSQSPGSDRRWEPWLGKAPLGKNTGTFFLFELARVQLACRRGLRRKLEWNSKCLALRSCCPLPLCRPPQATC